jgi:protein-disulfide isomerase
MAHHLRFVLLVLVCALVAVTRAGALQAVDIAPSQREAIERIIHDYLSNNPEVLIDAVRSAEDKLHRDADAKATRALSERRNEIFDDPRAPVGGDARGDVTIVEFFDYQCPYCKQALPTLQSLLNEDPKLRLIYKEMPVLGPQSGVAAHVALAAQRQNKYEAFHAAMMGTKGKITEESVYEVATSVGLDIERLKQDMAAPEIEQSLLANRALADALNIRGTPAFIIGNQIAPGAIALEALKNMIAEARKS